MAVVDDVRDLGSGLERSYPVYVRGRLQFRVTQIVYVGFSLDEAVMGFAFPKEEREALVCSRPATFHLPSESDMRFHWVHADLAALDADEARELVVDAFVRVAVAPVGIGAPNPASIATEATTAEAARSPTIASRDRRSQPAIVSPPLTLST